MTTRRAARAALIALLLVVGLPTATASSAPSCNPNQSEAGWPSLNGDPSNTRSQATELEDDLEPIWSFSGEEVDAPGGMRSTPIVSGGCVYVGLGEGYLGARGDVIALDADTGELVWHVQLDGSVLGLAAANGLIYATPSKGTRGDVALPVVTDSYQPAGSYAVALDARTGEVEWTSERLDDGIAANGTFINASPVAFHAGGRKLLFVPMAGGSGDGARVPMYFLDAKTGETVRRSYSMTDAEYEEGFGGTGIWSTAAYDDRTQHLYAGTADSDAHTKQHPYNNALLKIDANPTRDTFGQVVDAYSGTTEHANLDAVIGAQNNPLCGTVDSSGTDLPTFFDTSASVECAELDFDFGSSPGLFTHTDGRLLIGALQKSGVFHAVDAETMEADWTFFVGPGGPVHHSATPAIGPDSIHVGATPNLVFDLGRDDGALRWVSTTVTDLFAYQPLTLAGGTLLAINDMGFLVGIDAATGAPRFQRSIASDGGFPQCLGVGAGVAVTGGRAFVPCDAGGPVDLAGLPGTPGGIVAYG